MPLTSFMHKQLYTMAANKLKKKMISIFIAAVLQGNSYSRCHIVNVSLFHILHIESQLLHFCAHDQVQCSAWPLITVIMCCAGNGYNMVVVCLTEKIHMPVKHCSEGETTPWAIHLSWKDKQCLLNKESLKGNS